MTALLWGPKDDFIFVASRSLQFRMFSINTGDPVRSFSVCLHGLFICKPHVITGPVSQYNFIHCCTSFQGHKAPVAEIAIDSTGTLMASCSADKSIKVWDIEGGYCTHSFTGHRYVVFAVL